MRKEYNDRWNSPLVNPGFTLPEYEKDRSIKPNNYPLKNGECAYCYSTLVPTNYFGDDINMFNFFCTGCKRVFMG